jgi:hypothetical protein
LPKRNGERRRIHIEDVHSSHSLSDRVRMMKSRRLRWVGHVARMEGGREAFKILIDKSLGKGFPGSPRCTW